MSLLNIKLFVVLVLRCMPKSLFVPCVYAQIMCLAKYYVFFFPNLHHFLRAHRAKHLPKPNVQERSRTEI